MGGEIDWFYPLSTSKKIESKCHEPSVHGIFVFTILIGYECFAD